MKHLLVISNHAPNKWSNEQKEGWDKIDYIPFPNVPANATTTEVIEKYANPIAAEIGAFYNECDNMNAEGYITIQGEFSLCKIIFDVLHGEKVKFVFPTTERIAVEEIQPDGSVQKKSVFKFSQWREM